MSDFIDRANMYIVFMIYIVYILKKAERERKKHFVECYKGKLPFQKSTKVFNTVHNFKYRGVFSFLSVLPLKGALSRF